MTLRASYNEMNSQGQCRIYRKMYSLENVYWKTGKRIESKQLGNGKLGEKNKTSIEIRN